MKLGTKKIVRVETEEDKLSAIESAGFCDVGQSLTPQNQDNEQ